MHFQLSNGNNRGTLRQWKSLMNGKLLWIMSAVNNIYLEKAHLLQFEDIKLECLYLNWTLLHPEDKSATWKVFSHEYFDQICERFHRFDFRGMLNHFYISFSLLQLEDYLRSKSTEVDQLFSARKANICNKTFQNKEQNEKYPVYYKWLWETWNANVEKECPKFYQLCEY